MKFDARTAKSLLDGEHLSIEGCPGLRIIAKKTRRSWTYRYKSPIDGNMRQIKIGSWPAMSPVAAAGEWERLRTERDSGIDPAAQKREDRAAEVRDQADDDTGYTVAKLCDDYTTGHIKKNRKPKGAKAKTQMLLTKTEPLRHKLAVDVTRADAFNLLESMLDSPVSAGELRGELGAAWDYALDAGRIPESTPNWWRSVMRGRLRSKGKKIAGENIGVIKRVLSDSEAGGLIRWLPNFSTLISDAVIMYLWTGTRGAEIVAMEAREIGEEADGWWWTIPKAKTKNARHDMATDLRVPLVGRPLAVVKRRIDLVGGKGYLFPAKSATGYSNQATIGSQIYNHQPYSNVRPDRETPHLSVTNWAPHDLRRTARTMLAAMGCPDSVAESILGHVQEGVKGVYNRHSYDKERREWLGKLSVKLEQLAGT